MKILLINPSSRFLIEEKAFPAMGLLYLSAYLKANGYKDINFIDMNDFEKVPDNIGADIVGVYSNTPQFPEANRIIEEIKIINRKRDAIYVLGGPHISGIPRDLPPGDIGVIGEGENALLEIVLRKEKGLKQELIYHHPYITDLDSIPMLDRDIINIKSYKYFINKELATSVITSRGCPFGCYFCSNNAWGKSLRKRSPENIYKELEILKYQYGYRAFMFWDDTMTVDRKRLEYLCELMKNLDIIWRCNIRSDTVDLSILRNMRNAGCVEAALGIESGSQKILNIVNKGETVEKHMRAVNYCHEAGLRIKGFFIVGLPGENLESIKETENFLDEAKLDDADFSVYSPFPGSYIYNNREKFDISFKDDYEASWYKGKPGEYKSLVSTSGLSGDDIVSIRDRMERTYKHAKNGSFFSTTEIVVSHK